jgi:hypothetical protein
MPTTPLMSFGCNIQGLAPFTVTGNTKTEIENAINTKLQALEDAQAPVNNAIATAKAAMSQ